MLQELSVVEQRYLAVREVLDDAKVIDVATRYGVDRRWLHARMDTISFFNHKGGVAKTTMLFNCAIENGPP